MSNEPMNTFDSNISLRLIEKMDSLQENILGIRSDVNVINTKIDDFSYRLRKLEDKDEKIQMLANKLEIVLQKLEPSVEQLGDRVTDVELKITKIENNWCWVCTLVASISGVVVWGLQFLITNLVGR